MNKSAKKWGGVFLLTFTIVFMSGCEKREPHLIHDTIYLESYIQELDKNDVNYLLKDNLIETYVSDRDLVNKIFKSVINDNVRIQIHTEDSAKKIIASWESSSIRFKVLKDENGIYTFLFPKTSCLQAHKDLKHDFIPVSICH